MRSSTAWIAFACSTLVACGDGGTNTNDMADEPTDIDAAAVDAAPLDAPAAPALTGISPSTGFFPGGLTVTLTGEHLRPGLAVDMGGRPCTQVEVTSATSATCVTPSTAVLGAVDVVASDASGSATLTGAFTVKGFTSVTSIAGTGASGAGDGAGDVATFSSAISGLLLDGTTLYVADAANYKIRSIDISGLDPANPNSADVTVATIAGSGVMGSSDSTDGTGATATFMGIDDLALVDGTLYAMDIDWASSLGPARLRAVDVATGDTSTVRDYGGAGQLWHGGGGVLYAAECAYSGSGGGSVVSTYDVDDGSFAELAGGAAMLGDQLGVGAAARFNCPYGVIGDAAGDTAYVADYSNNKVKAIDLATAEVTLVSGSGVYGLVDDADATLGSHAQPSKLALAGDYLYVTDFATCAVRQIDLATGALTTLVSGCDSGVDGELATATIDNPTGVAYSPTFGLFVSTSDYGWAGGVDGTYRIRLVR